MFLVAYKFVSFYNRFFSLIEFELEVKTMNNDRSIAEIADLLSETPQRVRYMVSKQRIKYCRLIGNSRMYNEAAQTLVKEALFNIRIQK